MSYVVDWWLWVHESEKIMIGGRVCSSRFSRPISRGARTSIENEVFSFYDESLSCKLQFDAWLLWQQLRVSTIPKNLSGIFEKWGNFGSFKITESIIIFPLKLRNSHKNPANFWQGSHLHLFFVFLISFVKKKMEKCTVRLKILKHS